MRGEFHNHPELVSHSEFITHLEIDYLEEQAVLPERVSFSEFFSLDEMNNGQEVPPTERRKPLWLFWRTLAQIIVVLCSLILFAVMLLRYPVHVTFQLQAVQPDNATLNLHLTVLQDPASDIYYQVTDYTEGLRVAVSTLLEGDNLIFLQNLEPDTVYQINILRDGERIRGFLFNTLPAQLLPSEERIPDSPNTEQIAEEPVQEEPIPEEAIPVESVPEEPIPEEVIPVNIPKKKNEEENHPPSTPDVIIILPSTNPAATGPANPLAIDGVYGGDAGEWSIVVNLSNTDTGYKWMPTEEDEGTVMIDWQLRNDQGDIVVSGTTSYEEMIRQYGIPLPSSISSGNYSVDVQVNFLNTDNIITLLDDLNGGYTRENFIQSRPANLPTDVTITQTDNTSVLELIYNYLWEDADSDEGAMNGGYWSVFDMATQLTIDSGNIDNSLLGQEIPITLPDGTTAVGIYFTPQYENQGGLYNVIESTAYKEITLPDTGQTFRLFLLQPDSEEIPKESTVLAEETTSEEANLVNEGTASEESVASAEETASEEATAPAEVTISEETTAPAEETASEETTVPAEETASEETTAPAEESTSEETTAPAEESTSEETTAPTEESTSEETIASAEQPTSEGDASSVEETVDSNSTVTE